MFYRYERYIKALVHVFGYLPRPILRFLYRATEPFNGLLFVLLRYLTLANLCRKFGDNVYVASDVEIRFFENLSIGSNVSIHRNCYLDALGGIDIGSEVSIAHQSTFVSFEHTWSDVDTPIRDNPIEPHPITVADDVWIGAGVRVLGGARIAHRSVIAAGAVVTAKMVSKPGFLWAGIPAKPKKALPQKEPSDPKSGDGPSVD